MGLRLRAASRHPPPASPARVPSRPGQRGRSHRPGWEVLLCHSACVAVTAARDRCRAGPVRVPPSPAPLGQGRAPWTSEGAHATCGRRGFACWRRGRGPF